MVGGTLRDIRSHVSGFAAPTGAYAVVCDRTGREPLPLTGMRFGSREDAEQAVEAASNYRSALRRYDPQLPHHEPRVRAVADDTGVDPSSPRRDAPESADPDGRTRYITFCHDVSAAVFESLSATGHRRVESAAMETYLTLAEVVTERDDFCLTMLWSMMSELDARLDAAEQRVVVAEAAELLAGPNGGARLSEPTVRSALGATTTRLCEASFVDETDIDACPGGDAWEVTFGDYALAERTGRLPTLPIAVELVRRLPDRPVSFTEATPLADGRWRLRVEAGANPTGLVSLDATDEGRLNDSDYRL
ncbi:hypothetical protein SAMN04487947_1315 [Halogeometricum rufum]|uniref:Uncharacterized protein n=1 Tax=Halogeometricum rufum TaxID=553469 RepID=A0A1I6GL08_9EURY|nr:hypothetical protein [Halogeometricum rufum]SFR42836.1 hypothetical protein SAMN04487947_1315 [Halogeometricum rufum]